MTIEQTEVILAAFDREIAAALERREDANKILNTWDTVEWKRARAEVDMATVEIEAWKRVVDIVRRVAGEVKK